MESSQLYEQEELMAKNPINRYLTTVRSSLMAGGAIYSMFGGATPSEAWLFRDDIGAPHGIKGYEEQVNSVGMHHGHNHWPSEITWNTWNSST
jgi:hypothetical protein